VGESELVDLPDCCIGAIAIVVALPIIVALANSDDFCLFRQRSARKMEMRG